MLIPILGWMLFGLIIGAIARFVVPGSQRMGWLKTMLLGIIGSFVGGFVGYLVFGGDAFQASGWIGSIVGAVIVLLIGMKAGRVSAY
ncbi:GlsB/YeaQ/YmgE family stress response membrane protein [Roseiconus nitratireducens]|uniref:GlsB/YeaQ/YmgE family stress response membrane protein n=1 Tax=Roseiconus nitratireducens TaxID=2605748 RepID=A0A5M6D558_9BACT|nr:GlsB/YeaQ/YmgE family stress response membrane protein [Roseiconus nitratireducens]KAA5542624.1 GlsB/YeaQ/YmgE family stress response membrane protein [Roseiconus nitratireducens]